MTNAVTTLSVAIDIALRFLLPQCVRAVDPGPVSNKQLAYRVHE